MRTETPPLIRLEEYRPSDYLIDRVDLDIRLDPHATRIDATLTLRPNPAGVPAAPLTLDGDDLRLVSAELDGAPLPPDAYAATRPASSSAIRRGGPSRCVSSRRWTRPPTRS
jgi:aminopeptidase N